MQRLYALKDAPRYLGIGRTTFEAHVRPYLTAVRIGGRTVAFDRLEMDAWADYYKRAAGRPPDKRIPQCKNAEKHLDLNYAAKSGGLTSKSEGMDAFRRAVEQATTQRQRGI